jgi:hypothetical protein
VRLDPVAAGQLEPLRDDVEAEHALGAHLTSSLTLAGSDQVASGLVFDRSSVTIAGDRSRVTGCASFGAVGNAIMIRSGADARVDHCEISGGQRQGISVMPDPAHPDGPRSTC